MVFPGPVCKVEVSHKDKEKDNWRENKTTGEKKDWGVLVDKKWNMSELCILEAIITYWRPNQGMLLLLSTQVIPWEAVSFTLTTV